MKILLIGSGGREHTLAWKLAHSPGVTQMWCAPGNAGIAQERLAASRQAVECVNIAADDLPRLLAFAQEKKIELTVVGPDNPLALGIVDLFQQNRLRIWGPNQKAAQFEASKVFSQQFMERHGIPTARSGTFAEPHLAKAFAASLGGRCAVKADGLALGKGVLICRDVTEADEAIEQMLIGKAFGTAGVRIVIQELLEGIEISLHALCDGKTAKLFPTAQDHKRALNGDRGLNTGGMGSYSPAPFLDDAGLAEVRERILNPWLRGCTAEGIDFHGILYPGLMLTRDGPKVLEFNARFGDPETQVYLPRLENDLLGIIEASIDGTLRDANGRRSPVGPAPTLASTEATTVATTATTDDQRRESADSSERGRPIGAAGQESQARGLDASTKPTGRRRPLGILHAPRVERLVAALRSNDSCLDDIGEGQVARTATATMPAE